MAGVGAVNLALALALIVAAYHLGRAVQWVKDARDAMGARRNGRGRT